MLIFLIIFFALVYLVWGKLRFYAIEASVNPKISDNQIRIYPLNLFYYSITFLFFLFFFFFPLTDLKGFEKEFGRDVVLVIIILFILLLLIFVVLFLRYFLWRVEICVDGFSYRNWFGRKKTYSFDKVKIKVDISSYVKVYNENDKKIVRIPFSALNFNKFAPAAKEYYKQHNIDKKKHIKYIWD